MTAATLNPTPEYLTFNEVASLLRRSRQWVYDRIRVDDKFPRPIRVTEYSSLFKRSEVMGWIENQPRFQPDGVDAKTRRQRASVAVA